MSEVHGVNINTLFFSTFVSEGKLMIGADWLVDQEEVAARSKRKTPEPPWSGFWYVNVDECGEWNWEDCRKCGFLAASGGRIYSDQLKRLDVGARVFAYQGKAGYVGYGIVTETVRPATEFVVDGKPLFECVHSSQDLLRHADDVSKQVYVVGMDWKKTFSVQEAKSFPGVFANPNVVCKLRDPQTLAFLKKAFDVSE